MGFSRSFRPSYLFIEVQRVAFKARVPDRGLRLDKTGDSLENAGFSNENRQPQ